MRLLRRAELLLLLLLLGWSDDRHRGGRRDLESVFLVLVEQNAHGPHLLLYGAQRRHERRQRELVLGHESTDVVDVLSLLVVVVDVVLHVLQPHVEYFQRALN